MTPTPSSASSANPPPGRRQAHLDDVDRRLLDELSRDGRQSITTLAGRAHISRAQAYERVRRLREAGALKGFTTITDPVRSGLGTSAYLTVKLKQNAWRELEQALDAVPAVEHVALVGGRFDVVVLVRARDSQELRDVVFEHIQPLPYVLETQTHLVFEEREYPRTVSR